jgi:mono/diheme cytochrome c family protein
MKKLLAAVLAVSASLPALAAPPGSADGAALYKTNCAACHGADGKGTPTGPAIAGKQAKTVATIVNAHPPPMNKIELTPDGTAAVGRYVSGLKK